jgi:hypothetical protein
MGFVSWKKYLFWKKKMKKLVTILFALLLGSLQISAQDAVKLESFKKKVLPEYSMYFNKAELTENGQLSLTAVDKYIGLSADAKKTIMAKVTKSWQESLVLVNYGSKIELWGWSVEKGNTQLLDEWNLNAPQLSLTPASKLSKIARHPWFFYIGGIFGGDNQHNVNFTFNTRLGFFLLANKWDFATTLSTGSTKNSSTEGSTTSTGWTSFGLMSRVHFPIKKCNIRPNIGASVQFGNFTPKTSLSIGFMWFVGFGSLDVAISIGNEFTTMGGYTACPQMKSKR